MHRYAQVSGAIFALVSVLQLVRVLRGWPVQIGDVTVPPLASVCAFVVAAAMAFWGFRTSRSAA